MVLFYCSWLARACLRSIRMRYSEQDIIFPSVKADTALRHYVWTSSPSWLISRFWFEDKRVYGLGLHEIVAAALIIVLGRLVESAPGASRPARSQPTGSFHNASRILVVKLILNLTSPAGPIAARVQNVTECVQVCNKFSFLPFLPHKDYFIFVSSIPLKTIAHTSSLCHHSRLTQPFFLNVTSPSWPLSTSYTPFVFRCSTTSVAATILYSILHAIP